MTLNPSNKTDIEIAQKLLGIPPGKYQEIFKSTPRQTGKTYFNMQKLERFEYIKSNFSAKELEEFLETAKLLEM